MPLTIPELARAVRKSENYVRQHIFRKHLAVQKDGRNVSVTHDEALRWARERKLPFEPPMRAWKPTRTAQIRAARMTVLTLNRPETKPCNLLTVVRHRRQDALGPWSSQPSKTWTSEDLVCQGTAQGDEGVTNHVAVRRAAVRGQARAVHVGANEPKRLCFGAPRFSERQHGRPAW